MPFHRIFVLRFHVAAADINRIEFIRTDAPVEHLLAAGLGIKEPLTIFLDDGDRHRPVPVADDENGAVGVFRIDVDGVFLMRFRDKSENDVFVLNRIFGRQQIFACRAKDFLHCGYIVFFRGLNQCFSSLFRTAESFLRL